MCFNFVPSTYINLVRKVTCRGLEEIVSVLLNVTENSYVPERNTCRMNGFRETSSKRRSIELGISGSMDTAEKV